VARSALLPNLTGDLAETVQQTSLAASGFKFKLPGFTLPTIIALQLHRLAARLTKP